MKVKILHAADQHLGMSFSNRGKKAKELLTKERMEALQRIVILANEKNCDFLVIAGDLFDSTKIPEALIRQTTNVLESCQSTVLIIPGNHDYFLNGTQELWQKFSALCNKNNVVVLKSYEPFEQEFEGGKVCFFPAPCDSMHSSENRIGWIQRFEKNNEHLNIGIAHGNVTGLGLDDNHKYFNMSEQELQSAGIDLWLLGHIHVPFPKEEKYIGKKSMFMPGTHTPDGWDRKHPGFAWYIEVGADKQVVAERMVTGKIRFIDTEKTIKSSDEAKILHKELDELDKPNILVRLTLRGSLSKEEMQVFEQNLNDLANEFLHFETNNQITLKIDKEFIESHYPKDSLPEKLLISLLENENADLCLQLAHELIEKTKQK